MCLRLDYRATAIFFLTVTLLACNKWDDHTKVTNPDLNQNLLQEISKHSNLSKFTEYLLKTGLDKELSSSKTYTVWAPVNEALQAIDPAIAGDSAKLRLYMANHISNQAYYTTSQAMIRVPLLNGKRASFQNKKFDEATILEADLSVRNGVLHVLDRAVPPLQNLWEFVNSTAGQFKQNAFIVSQNFAAFDPSLAVIDSISATTGQPVYRPGTGLVARNRFNDQVYDSKREDKEYTYFLLTDAALKTETDSLNLFYKTGTTDSTYNLAAWSVIKDAMVEGTYLPAQLPPILTSKFGVLIPVNKSAVVETRRVSNGIVYIVNNLDFLTTQKVSAITVQGENPRGFFRPTGEGINPVQAQTGSPSAVFFRTRINPITTLAFTDLFIYGHGTAGLNVQYQAREVPSARYKVYWVAVNDTLRVNATINPVAFQQRLAMGNRTAIMFPYITVSPNNYGEVYLGEYIQPSFGVLDMFLTAANSTATGVNTLSLDYIRLEPQF